jgi:hypothetical protein
VGCENNKECVNGSYCDTATNICIDINECIVTPDICGTVYPCGNTPGSYECLGNLSLQNYDTVLYITVGPKC